MPKSKTFCSIDGCNNPCVGQGYCRAHYLRWYKYGDPLITKKPYRHPNKTCKVDGCDLPTIAKGFCGNHYALNRRWGAPKRIKPVIGQYIKDGYRYVLVAARHYEPEHRIVMERMLGRKLSSDEHVHHIDENTLNNSPSNLQIVSRSEHCKIHCQNQKRAARGHYC